MLPSFIYLGMNAHLAIINAYKQKRRHRTEPWISACIEQKHLSLVIKLAANASKGAKGKYGDKHPHQYRIPCVILESFFINLLQIEDNVSACKSFDELLQLIEKVKVKGIGALTIYDTALRIGANLQLRPDRIYLHAGTKAGAEKLLSKKIREAFIFKEDLPTSFSSSDLECWEIEDLLCHYGKNDFFITLNNNC